LHQAQRGQLAQERHPAGHGHGIGNLGHPRLAFTPHQLAAVENDDGQEKEEKRAQCNAEQLVGDRKRGRVERFARLPSRGQQENDARPGDGREVAAAHNAAKLQLGQAPPLAPAHAAGKYLRYARQAQAAGQGRHSSCQARLFALAASACALRDFLVVFSEAKAENRNRA
jgi:hypothetical protein